MSGQVLLIRRTAECRPLYSVSVRSCKLPFGSGRTDSCQQAFSPVKLAWTVPKGEEASSLRLQGTAGPMHCAASAGLIPDMALSSLGYPGA